jgi:hypothetical protein
MQRPNSVIGVSLSTKTDMSGQTGAVLVVPPPPITVIVAVAGSAVAPRPSVAVNSRVSVPLKPRFGW